MNAEVIKMGDGVTAIKVELGKDGKSIEEALQDAFNDAEQEEQEDELKALHDRLVDKLIRLRDSIKVANVTIKEALDKTFEGIDPEDDRDCYCPCCLAKASISLTHDDIIEIGADIVESILEKCHHDLTVKTSRDLDAIMSVTRRARSLYRPTSKTKSIEDMTREELIDELKKKK